jgi:putative transposase
VASRCREVKRLKALEEENRKLKKLLAEQMLDAATPREMLKEAGREVGDRAEIAAAGVLLRRDGIGINHKRLSRLYREERLAVRKRGGRKRALGTRAPLAMLRAPCRISFSCRSS